MADLGVLMGAAMTFVDVVGTYKLSPELKRRAEKVLLVNMEKLAATPEFTNFDLANSAAARGSCKGQAEE